MQLAAEDDEKADSTFESAKVLVEAIRNQLLPRQIITRKSIENAISVIMAVGGSTNAVLHFLAIARAVGVELNLDDFETIRSRVPVLCDLKPSGRYIATDLHKVGGIPQVMKMLLVHGLLHGDCITITGKTIAEILADVPNEPPSNQDVIRPWNNPMYPQGHLAILKGNLATEGAVAKITGVKNPRITGPARVFDSEEECLDAILAGKIKAGDVIVVRYEGPIGGPGMREMLAPTSAIIGAGLGDAVGLITDYWCGQPLTELEPQIRAYYQQLCDLNQFTAANCVLAYWQAALILLGQSEEEIPLRQDSYEEKVLAEAKVDFYRLCYFYLYRFTLNYWLEDFAKAEHDAVQTRQYLAGGMGNIVEPLLYFYDSLTVLATLGKSMTESESRWQRLQENQEKLKEWAHYAPMNYLHKYHLVEAQKHQLLNRKTEALEFYDLAIAGAKANGYPQEEALANELAAKFYQDWNKERIARAYMIEAYYGYARWGAKAKLAVLETRYPQLEGMGRSAYICPHQSCLVAARKKNRLGRALQATVPETLYKTLWQRLSESKNLNET
ncbi:hypothetical protein NUACC21_00460 [Scytonema sp. NUACC21]